MRTRLIVGAIFAATFCVAREDVVHQIVDKLKQATDEFEVRMKNATSSGASIVAGSVPRRDLEDQLRQVNTSQPIQQWIRRFIASDGDVTNAEMAAVIEMYSNAKRTTFHGLEILHNYVSCRRDASFLVELANSTEETLQASQDVHLLTSHLFMNLNEVVALLNSTMGVDNLIAEIPSSIEEYKELNECLHQWRKQGERGEVRNGSTSDVCRGEIDGTAEKVLLEVQGYLS